MSRNKKFGALLLALSFTAAACGSDDPETTEPDTTEAAETEAAETAESSESDDAMEDDAMEDEDHNDDAMEDDAMEDDEAMEDDAMEDDAMEEELPATVVDIASEAGSFTTLLAAAEAAGLVDALTAEGPITVFAPTDDAFAAALTDLGLTAEELLADTDTLTSILTYHVVEGKVLSTDLSDGMTAPTLNGGEITVAIDDAGVMIDGATVTAADLEAQNGVVHVIDSVLLPS